MLNSLRDPRRDPGEPPLVQLQDVSKSFDVHVSSPVRALSNVNLEVWRGEVVTLMGPSGSGKSTCLRVINGLETIDSGRVILGGESFSQSMRHNQRLRRKTAMIFQHFELFPHLTVLDNLRLAPCLTRGLTHGEATQRAHALLDKVGLSKQTHQYPTRLSGGQKQRVAIARALAIEPEVLLCDEPTSALDPELVGDVTSLLLRIAAEGMTMILVTHEIRFAREVSSRCLFLEQGTISVDLPVREFFAASSPSPILDTAHGSPDLQRLRGFLGKFQPESS